jgi:acetyl-CoA carboxylase biotin carboxyl carrier protein
MPVSIARLRELIELAGSVGVEGIDVVEDGTRVRISRTGQGPLRKISSMVPRQPEAVAKAIEPDILVAPMFGLLHLTPAPDAKPYVVVGQQVTKGQQLCLIEAMKMFNAFHSDRDGRLEAILAAADSEIASGQPLFRIVAG